MPVASTVVKKEFLVVYDYGTGGVWALVRARSAEEIKTKFEDLEVVDQRPDFITDEVLDDIRQKFSFDIDRPEGWITQLLRQEGTKKSD
jgi:hypothetical protein